LKRHWRLILDHEEALDLRRLLRIVHGLFAPVTIRGLFLAKTLGFECG
jgi:hypothetical protein